MKKLTNQQILDRAEIFEQLADGCEMSIDRFCSESEREARRYVAKFLRNQDKYWTMQLRLETSEVKKGKGEK